MALGLRVRVRGHQPFDIHSAHETALPSRVQDHGHTHFFFFTFGGQNMRNIKMMKSSNRPVYPWVEDVRHPENSEGQSGLVCDLS